MALTVRVGCLADLLQTAIWWARLDEIENRGRFFPHAIAGHRYGVRHRDLFTRDLDSLHEVADQRLSLRKVALFEELSEVPHVFGDLGQAWDLDPPLPQVGTRRPPSPRRADPAGLAAS